MTHPLRPSIHPALMCLTLAALALACRSSTAEGDASAVAVEASTRSRAVTAALVASDPAAPSARERNARAAYSRALALEREDAYHAAVAVYDDLLSASPDYRDAELRRTTLLAFIELAEDEYASALDAESTAEELAHLRLIRAFWPTFEDVGERIRSAVAARER